MIEQNICWSHWMGTKKFRIPKATVFLEHVLAEDGDCQCQSLRFQSIQVLLNRFRRILEAHAVILCRRCDYTRSQIQQMQHELVRMLGLNAESCDGIKRKIARVEGRSHPHARKSPPPRDAGRSGRGVAGPGSTLGSPLPAHRWHVGSISIRVRSSFSRLRSGRFRRSAEIHSL